MSDDATTDRPIPTRSIADSLKAATAGLRKRDVIDVSKVAPPKPERMKPTPEQMAKADYERVVGSQAYRRLPIFETMARKEGRIDAASLAALRFYRGAHEMENASPMRCALNMEGHGGGVPVRIPFSLAGRLLEDLSSGSVVDHLERGIGPGALATLRAVALEDKSFSQVAIERFGGRKVAWIDQEKTRTVDRRGKKSAYVDKVAPISGRHRQIIADEFAEAVRVLALSHQPYVSTMRQAPPSSLSPLADTEVALRAMVMDPIVPSPTVDPEFLNDAGRMREMGDIAAIIRARAFGGDDTGPDKPDV